VSGRQRRVPQHRLQAGIGVIAAAGRPPRGVSTGMRRSAAAVRLRGRVSPPPSAALVTAWDPCAYAGRGAAVGRLRPCAARPPSTPRRQPTATSRGHVCAVCTAPQQTMASAMAHGSCAGSRWHRPASLETKHHRDHRTSWRQREKGIKNSPDMWPHRHISTQSAGHVFCLGCPHRRTQPDAKSNCSSILPFISPQRGTVKGTESFGSPAPTPFVALSPDGRYDSS
jgi:hypothetical protein